MELCHVISTTDLLTHVNWTHLMMLRGVSRHIRESFDDGDDGFKFLSKSIADDVGLYCSKTLASFIGWRNMFWEHLYPARSKWNTKECPMIDHKIFVAVRLRHNDQSRLTDIILPLHQRLRMLKKGEKISSKEALGEGGLSFEEVQELLENQEDIDPQLLSLVLEAKQLLFAGSAATRVEFNPRKEFIMDLDLPSEQSEGLPRNDAVRDHLQTIVSGTGPTMGGDNSSQGAQGGPQDSSEPEVFVTARRGARLLSADSASGVVRMLVPGVGLRAFRFSPVFEPQASQQEVFERFAEAACVSAANGFNACLLAYGQTGSGKTHTVFGPTGALDDGPDGERHGLAVRCGAALLRAAEALRAGRARTAVSMTATYLQIYEEAVTDLLTGAPVALRGGAAAGAAEVPVGREEDLLEVLRRGEARKRRAATLMNEGSSRAHTVLTLALLQRSPAGLAARSQLMVVDLAGCEQLKKSGAAGRARREAAGINSSLLALRRVVTALNTHAPHVPYYESRLTTLLRGALGGSCRTHLLVAASGAARDGDETLAALRFGEDAGMVSNRLLGGAAASAAAAAAAVDGALAECEGALARMRAQGRQGLPAYAGLADRARELTRKRAALAAPAPALAPPVPALAGGRG